MRFKFRKFALGATLGIFLIFIMTAAYIGYWIIFDPAPHFFPFDDQDATYTIVKNEVSGNIVEISQFPVNSDEKYNFYKLRYHGEKLWSQFNSQDFEIIIAQSPSDLEPYLNKPLKVSGDFVNAVQKQCIIEKCIKFNTGPWVGVKLKTIELL